MSLETAAERLVTFRVGDALYALPVSAVERVLRWSEPRQVPGLPAWVLGVIDHEGHMVPVVDLGQRLHAVAGSPPAQARLLVAQVQDELCALRVDAVLDVRASSAADQVEAGSRFAALADGAYRAVARRDGALVMVLDPDHLLSGEESQRAHQAAEAFVHA